MDREGVNQPELAHRMGVTSQAVSQWCNSRTQPKNFERVRQIAKALGVPMTDLLIEEQPAEALQPHQLPDARVELLLPTKGPGEVAKRGPERVYMMALWDILLPPEREVVMMLARSLARQRGAA